MTPPERFATSRLLLRKPTVDDADRVFSTYAYDPVVTKFLAWHTHESVEDAQGFSLGVSQELVGRA